MSTKLILDWNEYVDAAREAIQEGSVLLKNNNGALPLKKNECVSIFGRIQNSYYKSGTGSGGMVNVTSVTGIVEGLVESGYVSVNKELKAVYDKWEESNPFNEGIGWGKEPWSQEEMPVSIELASEAAGISDTAIIIIGRTAGEDKDNTDSEGAYRLSKTEEEMMAAVRKAFSSEKGKRVIVLLNVGGIIDMSFVEKFSPDAVMYVWHGGMVGGSGAADVLIGKVSPSGRLTDTIAKKIEDYPSDKYFGDRAVNYYCEDIYVGYRYFETFDRDAVMYPFGYGLSYTDFSIETDKTKNYVNQEAKAFSISVSVKNLGEYASKEVVQVYVEAPNGKLGKPRRVLVDFAKTANLLPGNEETVKFSVPFEQFASYDDSGITGKKSAFVLEEGKYKVFAGCNVRDAKEVLLFEIESLLVIRQCEEALAPIEEFDRFVPVLSDGKFENGDAKYKVSFEKVPLSTVDMDERRKERIPHECLKTSVQSGQVFRLEDVLKKKITMEEFIAQLTDEDLSCIIRGEGMGSSRVTPGTASAFGGVSDRLNKLFGIPAVCCSDGPSGMRLDCGTKAFSLPIGTLLGSSFNTALVERLYSFMGMEMISNKVDCLLGPGMNIHRHPLNGRNFEYFSEDPYLTGKMGTAVIKGLKKFGANGTMKHFCGNNQEFRRRLIDSVISERALREIYLKAFEYAVRDNAAESIMTTYGAVNGLYTAGSYDLNTTILREDWKFKGIVMTDWWAEINERGKEPAGNDFAQMARSQNDLYMVCPDGASNATKDNTLSSLEERTLYRGELQRNAANICDFAMHTEAMRRLMGEASQVDIINKPKDDNDIDIGDVEFVVLDGELTVPLDYKESRKGTNYIMALDVQKTGYYELEFVGSSELDVLSQIPLTMFYTSIPILSITFNGTSGKDVSVKKNFYFKSRFNVMRLFVGGNGLKLKEVKYKFVSEEGDMSLYMLDEDSSFI